MKSVYFKDDFSFKFRLYDHKGEQAALPSHDWEARFMTPHGGRAFVAAYHSGKYEGCQPLDDGSVMVSADNHGLPPGQLLCRLTCWIPDATMADGTRKVVREMPIDILLTSSPCCGGADYADVVLLLPYIKGEKGEKGENGHSPYISVSGTWVVWDEGLHRWFDTGVKAVAETTKEADKSDIRTVADIIFNDII